ncbi:MAG: type II toxin-antitoxin system RelB/DinJ family antitoxin [Bacillota bacterium]|nr:type II toxin-antitoxin system RelB/DinJ family antitoxin [Bacillota bacterium]
MPNGLIQIRVDEELKTQASEIFEELGLDLSTAVRMFLRRSVQERGIPFSMKLGAASESLINTADEMNDISENNGNSKLGEEEIQAEIEAVRKERGGN